MCCNDKPLIISLVQVQQTSVHVMKIFRLLNCHCEIIILWWVELHQFNTTYLIIAVIFTLFNI